MVHLTAAPTVEDRRAPVARLSTARSDLVSIKVRQRPFVSSYRHSATFQIRSKLPKDSGAFLCAILAKFTMESLVACFNFYFHASHSAKSSRCSYISRMRKCPIVHARITFSIFRGDMIQPFSRLE